MNLDERIARSRKFRQKTVAEFFKKDNLKWWEACIARSSYKEQERAIARWIARRKGKFESALEVGPGTGRITGMIRPACEHLTLIEINERFSKQMSGRFPDASLLVADATCCTWGVGSYDLVVALEILVHIPDIKEFVGKVAAALKPKGTAILSITPLDYYLQYARGKPTIHRGIDTLEFERFARRFLTIRESHTSSTGQHRTYFLRK